MSLSGLHAIQGLLAATFGEKVQQGTITFVLGLAIVFLGMLIVVFFISLVGFIMRGKKDKDAGSNEEETDVLPADTDASPCDTGDVPEHVRAAIVAAIAAYYCDERPQNSFVVRKIKKLR